MLTPAPSPANDPQHALEAASDLPRVLASPVRLGILRELSNGSKYVHELVAALEVSQPLVSQHRRVLRTSWIVTARRQAREMQYSLIDDHAGHIALDAIKHAQE
ncbi:ArsR/SmtB family transcription factor [Streptomyces sp. NBC_00872]|uniref:ArsR/SmtB family transcription factor n=1 Tax=Streptomyces sp. NBC_00872 TaxID=2903686 RepID=UPI003870070B|nr:metalloregulator ArsR/SmtB family transcription factor [Streptomyces sp. NBC_00872]